MNRVKIDPTAYTYWRFVSAEPKMKFEDGLRTDEQETNAAGVPMYVYTLLVKEDETTKPETVTVKAPSAKPPTIPEFSPVGFVNLTAFAWVSGNRANLSFSADRIGMLKE